MSATMANQAPAFGFAFPSFNDTTINNVDINQPFDDFGFDFAAFTNFDNTTATTDANAAFGLDVDAFKQFMTDSGTHRPSEPSLVESTSTPASTDIVSPKSSLSSLDPTSPFAPAFHSGTTALPARAPFVPAVEDSIDIEALSNHHLERFLHYKALADEAQRKAEANALAQAQAQTLAAQAAVNSNATAQQNGAFQTLLAPVDINMNMGMQPTLPSSTGKGFDGSMLLSYAAPPSANLPPRQASFSYDPNMAEVSMAQAQADAHLQAHTAAAAQVQQQRMQTQYWVDNARRSFDAQAHAHGSAPMSASEPAWSRSSFSSAHTGSYPSTPQYIAAPVMSVPPVPKLEPMSAPVLAPIGAPVTATATMHMPLSAGIVPPSLPMLPAAGSGSASARSSSSTDSVQKPILNPHGGGRGYIPGKTPDDPKKRHKCDVCGRGFARAFNLKSHMATHDPDRSKPHMCPHYACKRGFSRLHDLERHRQGIHNDGPLVDAKLHGVTPSVARAQVRSNKSSSSVSTMVTTASSPDDAPPLPNQHQHQPLA